MAHYLELQPIDKANPEKPRWRTAFGAAGKTFLHGAGVVIDTVAITVREGNEAARQLAEERRQTLEAFTTLPLDQQHTYLAHAEEQARLRRQRIYETLSPIRFVQGLFHLDSEFQHQAAAPTPVDPAPPTDLTQV